MTLLEIADIIGIISFTLSGFLVAVQKKFDILGVIISAFSTALAGGIVRDVIANKTPYIFTSSLPVILVIVTVNVAILFKFHKIKSIENKTTFVILDTIGLISFSITGAMVAIEVGFNFTGILLLSLITAVGGGTIRDMIINRVPTFLIKHFYATATIITASIIYILNYFDKISLFSLVLTFIFGVILRLFAYYKKWQLPKFI